jgi:hypothetical protein
MYTDIDNNTSRIYELKNICRKKWENTPDSFPVQLQRYTGIEQSSRQVRLMSFIDDIIKLIGGFDGKYGKDPVMWGSSLKKLLYDCGIEVACLDGNGMKLLLNGGFCDVTAAFISEARTFDAAFKLDDMLQSLRNVWIMNCIQVLMGMKVGITPSVFAYSMLYPYTDNYLDAGTVSSVKKHSINHRFGRRLSGERLKAENPLEGRLFKLVDMIEGQYERCLYPAVYMSLQGIHEAQIRSMQQDCAALTAEDILDISVHKGGTSVLADACLIKGSLSEEEALSAFCFGVLLQLVDDLQDAAEDRSVSHYTLFSVDRGSVNAESITNRLINFTIDLLDNHMNFFGTEAVLIREVMKKSIIFLIMGAAACNSSMYGRDYLSRLEELSPVSFRCLKDSYRRIGREYTKLRLKLSLKSLEVPMAQAFASGILS